MLLNKDKIDNLKSKKQVYFFKECLKMGIEEKRVSELLFKIEKYKNNLKNNKFILNDYLNKELPINEKFDLLEKNINEIILSSKLLKLLNRNLSKRDLILTDITTIKLLKKVLKKNSFENVESIFEKIIKTINTKEQLNKSLEKEFFYKWNKEFYKKIAKSNKIKILKEESNILFIEINTHSDLIEMGESIWCTTNNVDLYNRYNFPSNKVILRMDFYLDFQHENAMCYAIYSSTGKLIDIFNKKNIRKTDTLKNKFDNININQVNDINFKQSIEKRIKIIEVETKHISYNLNKENIIKFYNILEERVKIKKLSSYLSSFDIKLFIDFVAIYLIEEENLTKYNDIFLNLLTKKEKEYLINKHIYDDYTFINEQSKNTLLMMSINNTEMYEIIESKIKKEKTDRKLFKISFLIKNYFYKKSPLIELKLENIEKINKLVNTNLTKDESFKLKKIMIIDEINEILLEKSTYNYTNNILSDLFKDSDSIKKSNINNENLYSILYKFNNPSFNNVFKNLSFIEKIDFLSFGIKIFTEILWFESVNHIQNEYHLEIQKNNIIKWLKELEKEGIIPSLRQKKYLSNYIKVLKSNNNHTLKTKEYKILNYFKY